MNKQSTWQQVRQWFFGTPIHKPHELELPEHLLQEQAQVKAFKQRQVESGAMGSCGSIDMTSGEFNHLELNKEGVIVNTIRDSSGDVNLQDTMTVYLGWSACTSTAHTYRVTSESLFSASYEPYKVTNGGRLDFYVRKYRFTGVPVKVYACHVQDSADTVKATLTFDLPTYKGKGEFLVKSWEGACNWSDTIGKHIDICHRESM